MGFKKEVQFNVSEFLRNSEIPGLFEEDMSPPRVRAEQSACPAREQAPFCVFRTGRQDCKAP